MFGVESATAIHLVVTGDVDLMVVGAVPRMGGETCVKKPLSVVARRKQADFRTSDKAPARALWHLMEHGLAYETDHGVQSLS